MEITDTDINVDTKKIAQIDQCFPKDKNVSTALVPNTDRVKMEASDGTLQSWYVTAHNECLSNVAL